MNLETFHAWIDQVQDYNAIDLYNLAVHNKRSKALTRDQLTYLVAKLHDKQEHDLVYSLAINLI